MPRTPSSSPTKGQLRVPWTTDDSVLADRETEDERRFTREQAAKAADRAAIRTATRRPNGTRFLVLAERRCGRCRNWSYPSRVKPPKHVPVNLYGDCGELVVLDRRAGDAEKGQVLDHTDVDLLIAEHPSAQISYDPLRTMAGYGCRLFAEVARAADPDVDLSDEARDRLEEVAWAS